MKQIALGDTLPYVDSNGITKQAEIRPDQGFDSAPGASTAEVRQANLERAKERLPKAWGKRIDVAIKSLLKFFS